MILGATCPECGKLLAIDRQRLPIHSKDDTGPMCPGSQRRINEIGPRMIEVAAADASDKDAEGNGWRNWEPPTEADADDDGMVDTLTVEGQKVPRLWSSVAARSAARTDWRPRAKKPKPLQYWDVYASPDRERRVATFRTQKQAEEYADKMIAPNRHIVHMREVIDREEGVDEEEYRSLINVIDQADDIFGPIRTYLSGISDSHASDWVAKIDDWVKHYAGPAFDRFKERHSV